MRVPLDWLREYCDPAELDVHAIERRLTMTGTKVEAIHHHGVPSVENFVVGRLLDVQPHPDADRLRVCEVDLGEASPDGPATTSVVMRGPAAARMTWSLLVHAHRTGATPPLSPGHPYAGPHAGVGGGPPRSGRR